MRQSTNSDRAAAAAAAAAVAAAAAEPPLKVDAGGSFSLRRLTYPPSSDFHLVPNQQTRSRGKGVPWQKKRSLSQFLPYKIIISQALSHAQLRVVTNGPDGQKRLCFRSLFASSVKKKPVANSI